jgi:hypothetical protein
MPFGKLGGYVVFAASAIIVYSTVKALLAKQ